jgi:hypothetical protein
MITQTQIVQTSGPLENNFKVYWFDDILNTWVLGGAFATEVKAIEIRDKYLLTTRTVLHTTP